MSLIYFMIFIVHLHNPIFIQERTGYKRKPFKIFKFKTIKNNNVTLLGKFLRKYKLDELPQLINIFINDMSFVGPRPLPVSYDSYYSDKIAKRFLVMPGITGLSQIKIYDNSLWKRKFRYDIIYYKKACLNIDMYILCKTVNIFSDILRNKVSIEESHTPLV